MEAFVRLDAQAGGLVSCAAGARTRCAADALRRLAQGPQGRTGRRRVTTGDRRHHADADATDPDLQRRRFADTGAWVFGLALIAVIRHGRVMMTAAGAAESLTTDEAGLRLLVLQRWAI